MTITEYLLDRKFIKPYKENLYRTTMDCPSWCHVFQSGIFAVPVLMIGTKNGDDLVPIKIMDIDDFEDLERIINSMKKTKYEQN